MKHVLTICTFAMVAALAAGPTVKLDKYHGWGDNKLSFNEQMKVAGDKNYYDINLLQSKPDKKGNQKTFITLSAPSQKWNFGRAPSEFLFMKVNGISLNKIQPVPGSIKPWSKKDSAGAEFLLNFDGTKIIVNMFMKTGSPLLFLTFTQPEKQLVPIKGNFTINFNLVISRLLVNEKKITIWNNVYNRQAKTESRLLKQQHAALDLTAADKYLIFSDEKLDGSGKGDEKGVGPCLLAFDLADGITGKLLMRNAYSTHVTFTVPGTFKEFRCAVLQHKAKISNDEFMKRFQADKNSYTVLK